MVVRQELFRITNTHNEKEHTLNRYNVMYLAFILFSLALSPLQ